MAHSHPVRAHALSLLAPCPLRLTSALSPRRCDDQPVGLFDEPALVRVPRTAHVLPAAPLAYNPCPCPLRPLRGLVSPGSRTGPCTKPSSAPPLAGACRRSSSRVGRPLRRRGPTPLFPTPPPAATRPLLSVPGALALPAAARAQPPSPRYAFFRGLLSDACTLHAARLFSLFHSVAVLHFVFVACDWLVASTLRVRASFRE